MRVLSGRDGDVSGKCYKARPLLGEGIAAVCGLCLLFSNGKAKTARRENTGFLDRFVGLCKVSVFCRRRFDIPSGEDADIMIGRNICRRKGSTSFCCDADISPRDIR